MAYQDLQTGSACSVSPAGKGLPYTVSHRQASLLHCEPEGRCLPYTVNLQVSSAETCSGQNSQSVKHSLFCFCKLMLPSWELGAASVVLIALLTEKLKERNSRRSQA